MIDTGNSHLAAEPPRQPGWRKTNKGSGLSARPFPFWLAGALAGGIALGAGGLAFAATATGHFARNDGPPLEHIQQFVLRALDSVGATTAQEAKIHDIIAANVVDMGGQPKEHDALRTQVLDLLRKPTVDRAAVEQLRVEQVAKLDAKSKKIVGAVLDMADQLTPEQRAKLADRAEAMALRGPMGGAWGGPHGGLMDDHRQHRPIEGTRSPADEPDYGPDNVPDKG